MEVRSLVFVIALASASCMNVDYVSTNSPPHPMKPRAAAEVIVFQAGLPSRPYVEVGYLDVRSQTNDPEFLLDELREEAGTRGCDAIVFLGNSDATSARATGLPTTLRPPKNNGYRAICVVYVPPT